MTLLELENDLVMQHEIIANARRTGSEWPWFPFRGVPYPVHVKYRKKNPAYAKMVDKAKAAYHRERDIEDIRMIFAGKIIPVMRHKMDYNSEFERNRDHGLIPKEVMWKRYRTNKLKPLGAIVNCVWCNRPVRKSRSREVFCSLNCRVGFHLWKKGQTWNQGQ